MARALGTSVRSTVAAPAAWRSSLAVRASAARGRVGGAGPLPGALADQQRCCAGCCKWPAVMLAHSGAATLVDLLRWLKRGGSAE